ncbi:DUF1778 domain-containing protein (plasmid) [Cereibacter azotoformans]|uniref:type II toxin -antitoxin system TacA 1-like antitoxin n=1 Tax=Cereibacter azotoformans TaxID=43057 RepID=UPI001EEBAA65|nr:DUF1778 domain-containing protein [Cereibacter azotoformans]ULB12291.1 DUF1778 domain-containing protein [Cereibacter azotoformans]
MKAPDGNSADITRLKPCDHQAFFDALDSPASPTEALRAAFRRRNDFPCALHDIKESDDS